MAYYTAYETDLRAIATDYSRRVYSGCGVWICCGHYGKASRAWWGMPWKHYGDPEKAFILKGFGIVREQAQAIDVLGWARRKTMAE